MVRLPFLDGVAHKCNGTSLRGCVLYGKVDPVLGIGAG